MKSIHNTIYPLALLFVLLLVFMGHHMVFHVGEREPLVTFLALPELTLLVGIWLAFLLVHLQQVKGKRLIQLTAWFVTLD